MRLQNHIKLIKIISGATAYVFKAKLASDCGLIAGLEATPAGPSSIKYHATYPFKNMTFGVAGGLANPTALNYAIQSEGVSLETDLTNFSLNVFNKVNYNFKIDFNHHLRLSDQVDTSIRPF